MGKEIINAQIESTQLGFEDHDILTFFLNLRWGCEGQGFGGLRLGVYSPEEGVERKPVLGFGSEVIARVLHTVGVRDWKDLTGKYVRVEHDHNRVYRIGHIVEDRWFDPDEVQALYRGCVVSRE